MELAKRIRSVVDSLLEGLSEDREKLYAFAESCWRSWNGSSFSWEGLCTRNLILLKEFHWLLR